MSEIYQAGLIGFESLRIVCIIGVNPEERNREQEIFVDMKVEIDVSNCVVSDKVADTVNYVTLADLCTSIAQCGKYRLLEAYGNTVLETIMKNYPINWAWICVKKPMALPCAKHTSVELSKGVRGT